MEILGVNEVGHESGNATFTDGRDLAWLQEDASTPVWKDWGVTYRDVWILDEQNKPIDVYNLTEHDLEDPANFEELKQRFLEAVE